MSDVLWAVRLGDALDHTSVMADILGGVLEVAAIIAMASTCLKRLKVTSCKLQHLAPLPTATPESAGLCALGAVGNLVRVTAHQ